MTNSIAEIDGAQTFFIIGSNTTHAHPVIAQRIRRNVRYRGAKLIVANPKAIELTWFADHFIQHQPGSDVALLMGMCRYIVENDLHDKEFIAERCENFDAFLESLEPFTPEFVEKVTGVPWGRIAEAAHVYATSRPSQIYYAMGITQHSHGTDNVLAVANLAMLTGNVGREFTGVNPLRGQNNVQGACDVGGLPDVYPGYQKVTDPAAREKFRKAWGVENLDDEIGLTHTEIFDAVLDGRVKAIYLVGENPLLTEANSKHARKAIEKLDFLVVQDMFMSETAQYADVILPACSYAEKEGTFTNTERRIQRVRRAIPPRGDSKPDWWITCQIARAMGASGFDFEDPSEIMDELASVTPIYGGISYDRLDGDGLQWPCRTPDDPGTKFLHKTRFSRRPSGKGQFVPLVYRPSAEIADADYPLILTTDRSLYHYHSATLTRRVAGLEQLNSREYIQINPEDAARLGIRDGDWVEVTSRRGTIRARAKVTGVCPDGVCSMTFHFWESPTNEITNPALDPVAKIPETKVAAVRLRKVEG